MLKFSFFKVFVYIITVTCFSSCNEKIHSNSKTISSNQSIKPSDVNGTMNDSISNIDLNVRVVFQDSRNHYWFGGNEKGLYNYNGSSLKTYTIEDGLCSTNILGIQEDKFGNIFLDTSDGVCKFDGKSFTMLEVTKGSKKNWQLGEDDLWFRAGWNGKGPYRYDGTSLFQLEFPKTEQEDTFNSKYPNVLYSPYGIYSIYKDSKGNMWFGTSSLGACRFDGQTISWIYENDLTNTPGGGAFGIRNIIEDKAGDFWFTNSTYSYQFQEDYRTTNGSNYLNYQKKPGMSGLEKINPEEIPYYMSSVLDDQGDLWMVTYDDGVYQYIDKKLIHHPFSQNNQKVLFYSIYIDKLEKIWVISHNNGLFIYNGIGFEKFRI